MSTRRHHHTILRRVSALLAAVAVLLVGLLARSPEAHDHVHEDAGDETHACAITLAQSGFTDTAAAMPQVLGHCASAPAPRVPGEVYVWSAPRFWLLPAHAPPVAS